jgi:hypothetical protein
MTSSHCVAGGGLLAHFLEETANYPGGPPPFQVNHAPLPRSHLGSSSSSRAPGDPVGFLINLFAQSLPEWTDHFPRRSKYDLFDKSENRSAGNGARC